MTARSRSYRFDSLFPKLPKDAEGYWLCRYCGKRIAKAKRYLAWHSTCQHEAHIRAFVSFASGDLHKREHGVCRHCGIDTDALTACLRDLDFKARGWHAWDKPPQSESETALWKELFLNVAAAMRKRGWNIRVPLYGLPGWNHLWEMDHIREHAEGGDLEPENLQTLCVPCHKAKTRAYAAAVSQSVDREHCGHRP